MTDEATKAAEEAAAAETAKAGAQQVEAGAAAANAGVAAATAGAVLATTAATKIAQDAEATAEELEEEQAWLRQQVEAQGKALGTLAENQSRLESQTGQVLAGLERLTASISAKPPEPEKVNPEEAAEKNPASSPEAQEALTEKKPKEKPAPKRIWA